MKLTSLATLSFCIALPALAAESTFPCNDCMVPQVVCHEAGDARDTGYGVAIESGGFAGLTFAHVSRITIAGALPVLSEPVQAAATTESYLVGFRGPNFNLLIDRSREVEGYAPANVKFLESGEPRSEELLCSFR